MLRGIRQSSFKAAFLKWYDLFCANRRKVKRCPTCFKTIVKPFLYTAVDYELLRLSESDYWLMVGVTGQQGMLTPTRHLIIPLVYPGVRVCNAHFFAFLWITRLISLRYLYIFIYFILKNGCRERATFGSCWVWSVRGILTPPRHLIQSLVYPQVRACHAHIFDFCGLRACFWCVYLFI